MNAFHNRLKKRLKHMRKWARRWPTEAWRLYDRDIPEYPWSVDIYGEAVYLQEYPHYRTSDEARAIQSEEVLAAIEAVLDTPRDRIFTRTRVRQQGDAQYERQDDARVEFQVNEGGLNFLVNLHDYIDTGLFLDHRNLRREVAELAKKRGRNTRVLNLFCYTGAFSVWAASRGAHTTSVDLSNTYLEWAQRNMRANNIDPQDHVFSRYDILKWLPREKNLNRKYDLIVLDPPTFSRSKRMERNLDIQRDHVEMISHCLDLLSHNGTLYFSTNFRDFSLDESLAARATEITSRSIPDDFREKIHRAWEFHALT